MRAGSKVPPLVDEISPDLRLALRSLQEIEWPMGVVSAFPSLRRYDRSRSKEERFASLNPT
jgi:hypothetical protein